MHLTLAIKKQADRPEELADTSRIVAVTLAGETITAAATVACPIRGRGQPGQHTTETLHGDSWSCRSRCSWCAPAGTATTWAGDSIPGSPILPGEIDDSTG